MRNAFEPQTSSAEAGPGGADGQQKDNSDVPTPELSPDDQKLRAITKIMLGSEKEQEQGEKKSSDEKSPSGLGGHRKHRQGGRSSSRKCETRKRPRRNSRNRGRQH